MVTDYYCGDYKFNFHLATTIPTADYMHTLQIQTKAVITCIVINTMERTEMIRWDKCRSLYAMGEIGQSMESRYKETEEGGLADTKTGREIAKKVLIRDIDILTDNESSSLLDE